jgi:hypothetical protein
MHMMHASAFCHASAVILPWLKSFLDPQVNKSDLVGQTVEQRLAEAKRIAEEKNIGAKSGLDPTGKLKEGDRDPVTGRLILDPLKIPSSDQGAPGSVSCFRDCKDERRSFKPTYTRRLAF